MILYRFVDSERFSILESGTTVPGSVALEALNFADRDCLRIRYRLSPGHGSGPERRPAGDTSESARIVIALPLIAIDGEPEQFELDVHGDASGCEIVLEAMDASMDRVGYSFGVVDFAGWRTCRADIGKAAELPIQFFQLDILPAKVTTAVGLCFAHLTVTGQARIVPSGLADGSG